jgi:hypothetical protein
LVIFNIPLIFNELYLSIFGHEKDKTHNNSVAYRNCVQYGTGAGRGFGGKKGLQKREPVYGW